MKWFKNLNPIVQTALVVVTVGIVLNFARPYLSKVPVVGKYI